MMDRKLNFGYDCNGLENAEIILEMMDWRILEKARKSLVGF
jgi:hypothetical protein